MYVERGMQTFNDSSKNKEVQTAKVELLVSVNVVKLFKMYWYTMKIIYYLLYTDTAHTSLLAGSIVLRAHCDVSYYYVKCQPEINCHKTKQAATFVVSFSWYSQSYFLFEFS
jgi:hypothetical protein